MPIHTSTINVSMVLGSLLGNINGRFYVGLTLNDKVYNNVYVGADEKSLLCRFAWARFSTALSSSLA